MRPSEELRPALNDAELDALFTRDLRQALSALAEGAAVEGPAKSRGPVLVIPPDVTRIHSRAGFLAGIACRELGQPGSWSLGGILPALGTHRPLSPEETSRMFPGCPKDRFIVHNWKEDTVELGRIEAEWVEAAFGGPEFRTDFPVTVNRLLRDGPPAGGKPFSLIISIGQVVPHEVAGMANHAKNIFVGTGGAETINKSHYLGALYGLEQIMGKAENPVRALFDEALKRYGGLLPPILWVLTVVDLAGEVQGLFTGFGRDCFERAAALSEQVNIIRLPRPAQKIVVCLAPDEYRSTWLGNKAVYRTRMAIADGGELAVLAPGLDCFGEAPESDALIRRYGYRGRDAIMRAVADGEASGGLDGQGGESGGLASSLSAAAHLIHGSSEGRFTIRYCTKAAGPTGRREIENLGYQWGNLDEAFIHYGLDPDCLPEVNGWRKTPGGEEFYFISNPALGLWKA